MSSVATPNIRVPRRLQGSRRRLVAIPETEYRRFRQFVRNEAEILADLRESEADVRAGRVVAADSIDEAVVEFRRRGLLDAD